VQPLPEARNLARSPDGGLGVRFENVCFAYAGGSPVLCDLDLEIAAGSIVAVCGETGSGKSTMLNLLSRFYDPDSGSARVGGIELSALRKADLRTAVALATQRPVLFSVTLRENLCAARPEATEDEMLAACEVAGVASFIDDLPDGYDTLIGERGVNLSGGQRQRVALARALISSARVLVLDDPLSAVDTETEEQIVRRLRPALAGRPVVLSSQRLSTVTLDDRAVVLEEGVIVEDAPPRRLLRAGGTSSDCSGTRSLSRKRRVALTRLSLYVRDQRGRIALLALAAAFTSGVQVGAGCSCAMRSTTASARTTLPSRPDVAIYVGVNAAAWLVGSFLILGLAQLGQLIVLRLREHLFGHLTTPAALLLGTARGLDHLAHHERRRRTLRRALGGPRDARRQRPHAHGGDDRAGAARLAPRARHARDPAADAGRLALVPDALSRGVRRRPHADLRPHRPDRRVARRRQ
jgi:ABC-type multidrug transport system ATPase subunit